MHTQELKQFITAPLAQLETTGKQEIVIAGLVHALRVKRNKQGNRMAIVTLEDQTGRMDMVAFSKTYATYGELLQKDQLVIIRGDMSLDNFTGEYRITANELMDLPTARERFAQGLYLSINPEHLPEEWLPQLKTILTAHSGGDCPIYVFYADAKARVKLQLKQDWYVKLADLLFEQLSELLGHENITLQYKR